VSVLWARQPATAAKHQLYKRYFDAWWPILLQPSPQDGSLRPRVTYLDAFAGPGRYTGGEEGSPVFAVGRLLNHTSADRMQLSRGRVRLLFMERDRDTYDYLCAELGRKFGSLDDLPVQVVPKYGEAGTTAAALLQQCGAWGHPILAVFDSWGNVNVPWTLIRRLAHNPSSEVIVTFGPNWFSRRDKLEPEQLDIVFGGRQYWQPAARDLPPEERWRLWLACYREALRRAGFRHQLHFEIVPRTGLPLYLVYGTGHTKGVEVMKAAMWDVDGTDGMGFRDPRIRGAPAPGQLSLFGSDENPELLELIKQRLADGPASLADLRQWLLVETARWLPKHASQAVRTLRDEARVSVSPAGRVTTASVVTLR
jgi:three-Cys-motif partner protein